MPPMPRKRRWWGHVGVGNWAPNKGRNGKLAIKDRPGTAVVGVCAECHRIRPAFELTLHKRPFTDEEFWACKDGCDVDD